MVWAGISLRDFRHPGLMINLEISKKLRLAYAFELPTNSLIRNNFGTHEIGITLDASIRYSGLLKNRRF